MASATDVREWARQQGMDVKARGNLPRALVEQYDAAHPDLVQSPTGVDGGSQPMLGDLYDDGVTEADFPGPADLPAAAPAAAAAEKPPRPAAPPRRRERVFGKMFARARTGPKTAAKKKQPRVKLDSFAENLWTDLAQVAPWPPLRMCLQFQGAYAATVMDEVVAGTFADPLLQLAARADGTFRALDGLFGPPLFVSAICMLHRVETGPDGKAIYEQNGWPVFDARTNMLFAGLKYSLMQMARIADLRTEEIQAKAAEIDERQAKADALIGAMFAQWRRPVPPSPDVAAAQQANGGGGPAASGPPVFGVQPGFLYPEPPGMDGTGADPGRT